MKRSTTRPKRAPEKRRPEAAGFDPLAQGAARYAGAIPMDRGTGGTRLLFYTSPHEFAAAIIALCHHNIGCIGRGDVSDRAARLRGITGPSGPRRVITGLFEGEPVDYLPDYDSRTVPGASVTIEGGDVRRKAAPRELAKLRAAEALCRQSGGEVWVVDANRVPKPWVRNATMFYLRSLDRVDPALATQIEEAWERDLASIKDLIKRDWGEHSLDEVEAAMFTVAGRLLRQGRLAGPIDRHTFSRNTKIRALGEDAPRIEPPGIIRDLDELVRLADELGGPLTGDDDEDAAAEDAMAAAFDLSSLAERHQDKNRLIAQALDDLDAHGGSVAEVAERNGINERALQRVVKRVAQKGAAAAVLWGTSRVQRGSSLEEELQDLIRELHSGTERLSVQAIVDHPKVHALAEKLEMTRSPGWSAVNAVVQEALRTSHAARKARAGKAQVFRTMFGRSMPTNGPAAFILELDEEWVDLVAQAFDGSKVTIRLHMGVLICVATRAVLAVVVSPKALDQWDYRRLLLRAMLSKDDIRRRHGIRSPWPAAMPYVVRADRGKIQTAKLVFQAAIDLPIIVEFAPIKDGHAKPFVESFFGLAKRLFEHRLKVTTKGSPIHRGAHDPAVEAIKGRVDVDKVETLIMKWIGDVYHNRWHGGIRATPGATWRDRVREFGLRQWLGTPDELRSLLKRDAGLALVTDHGVTYNGYWYGHPRLQHLFKAKLRRKVDDDDVRSIDLYDAKTGKFVCTATNAKLQEWPRPVSTWELRLAKGIEARAKVAAIQRAADADASDAATAAETKKARRQQHQQDRSEETATQAMRELAEALMDPNNPEATADSVFPEVVADDPEDDAILSIEYLGDDHDRAA